MSVPTPEARQIEEPDGSILIEEEASVIEPSRANLVRNRGKTIADLEELVLYFYESRYEDKDANVLQNELKPFLQKWRTNGSAPSE